MADALVADAACTASRVFSRILEEGFYGGSRKLA
jgi:hypothetical protein